MLVKSFPESFTYIKCFRLLSNGPSKARKFSECVGFPVRFCLLAQMGLYREQRYQAKKKGNFILAGSRFVLKQRRDETSGISAHKSPLNRISKVVFIIQISSALEALSANICWLNETEKVLVRKFLIVLLF